MPATRERRDSSLLDCETAHLLINIDDRDEEASDVQDGSEDMAKGVANGTGEPLVEQDADPVTTRALVAIFCSLYIGRFLCALDGTVIVTLLARISSEFHEFRSVSWIASSYLISLAVFQPMFGKISDIYGRKSLLLISNSMFAIGCILCGFAPNIWFLVFARIITGVGGSGLNSLSVITLSDLVPLRERGLLHGIGSVIFNLGAAVGGVFGGVITEVIGWRWAFFIQVPFIVISAIAIHINLKSKPTEEIQTDKLKRIDFGGSIALVFALGLFLLALSMGGNYVPWSHPLILILFPLSFLFLAAFVHIETKIAKEPVLTLTLLKDRTTLGSAVSNALIYMIMYSQLFYVPIYLVAVRGISETTAGTNIVSNFVGNAIGAIATGSYMRATGKYYRVLLVSALLLFVGSLFECTFGPETSVRTVVLYMMIPGICSGCLLTSTLVALIASVGHEFQAVATSIQYSFRAVGSTLGVSIASAIFQNVLTSRLFTHITDPAAIGIVERVLDSVEEIGLISEEYRPLVKQSYLDACRSVFTFAAFLAFLNIISCAFMREHTLHTSIRRGH
ncbi:major facilitator superfamily domain-containing protein [Lipomyces orientalis]|uniref:Major facilitator superfamily domain-containing protein n=1 Tax=Lipomyces orientalis TaxID=1233043 RepID=A0ACC3THB0_9ASCO